MHNSMYLSVPDLPMDNYIYWPMPHQPEQRKELADCRKRKPSVEDDRRRSVTSKKMRLQKNTEHVINNNSSSNFIFSKGNESGKTSESPPAWLNPLETAYNADNMPLPKLLPSPAKAVNWRLACFLAREYLSCGTLLGKPWPTQDLDSAQPKKQLRRDEAAREKVALYSTLTTNFLRSGDIHIPDIFNPSQLAALLGLE